MSDVNNPQRSAAEEMDAEYERLAEKAKEAIRNGQSEVTIAPIALLSMNTLMKSYDAITLREAPTRE